MIGHQNNHYKRVFSNPGPNAQGAIVASMPAGSLVGALIVTWLGDKIGRKKTIILAGMIWVVGSILQSASVVSIAWNFYGVFPYVLLSRTGVCL
jgi:MFS family permease